MSLYIDSSCFIKVLLVEPETPRVLGILKWEMEVVVSELSRIEALIQFQRRLYAKELSEVEFKVFLKFLADFIQIPPFVHRKLTRSLLEIAKNQVLGAKQLCKTLDRLHLAAMEELGVKRLLTNDLKQAKAARELGFEVIMPR